MQSFILFTVLSISTFWLYNMQNKLSYSKENNNQIVIKDNWHNAADNSISKVTDYLYETTISNLDYDFAREYFKARYKWNLWACSSIRNWNFIWRNYDRYYDESPEFIIHIPAAEDRHASINIAVSRIKDELVQQWLSEEELKILPFMTTDWINDAWVAININVVPTWDMGYTTWTNPEGEDRSAINIVRYILDYADSVDNAIELLQWLNIYAPMTETFTQEVHFMISDPNKTVIVEFINNQLVVIENNIMTNYYLATELTSHANGIERYNLLNEQYQLWETKGWMIELMKKVWYTNLYNPETNPFRYSEYYMNRWEDSYWDLTIDSEHEDLAQLIKNSNEKFINRERNWIFWQTVHTAVYDIENKSLTIIPQESDKVFEFNIL